MEEYINVIVKEPGKAPVEITIRNELAPLNDLVDGYIETVQWDAKHVLIVNEEGKLRHMECNFLMRNMDMIVGTAVWAGVDGEDLTSVAPGLLEEVAEETGYGPDAEEDLLACGDLEDILAEFLGGDGEIRRILV